ncbi:MAG: hypothetical protein WDO14_21975 [Bacteroidota bacterium]
MFVKNIVLTGALDREGIDDGSLSTDVIVELDDGQKYIATFYASDFLEATIREERSTPVYNSGHYYKILNMVLVKNLNYQEMLEVIDEMIDEGDFQLVFNKV